MRDASFNALVCDFALAFPQVRAQVDASSRDVDLVREGYDVTLRAAGNVQENRDELASLYQDILIGVTSFFRLRVPIHMLSMHPCIRFA